MRQLWVGLSLSAIPVLDSCECLLCRFAVSEFSETMNRDYQPLAAKAEAWSNISG
jgi:hypothetical protein